MKHLPRICGIAPPSIRRDVAADVERLKKKHDSHGQRGTTPKLKFKRSFLMVNLSDIRAAIWSRIAGIPLIENSASGHASWLTNTDRMHPQ